MTCVMSVLRMGARCTCACRLLCSAAIEANPRVLANVQRELQAMVKVSDHGNVVKALDVDWKGEWPKADGSKKVRAAFGVVVSFCTHSARVPCRATGHHLAGD